MGKKKDKKDKKKKKDKKEKKVKLKKEVKKVDKKCCSKFTKKGKCCSKCPISIKLQKKILQYSE